MTFYFCFYTIVLTFWVFCFYTIFITCYTIFTPVFSFFYLFLVLAPFSAHFLSKVLTLRSFRTLIKKNNIFRITWLFFFEVEKKTCNSVALFRQCLNNDPTIRMGIREFVNSKYFSDVIVRCTLFYLIAFAETISDASRESLYHSTFYEHSIN